MFLFPYLFQIWSTYQEVWLFFTYCNFSWIARLPTPTWSSQFLSNSCFVSVCSFPEFQSPSSLAQNIHCLFLPSLLFLFLPADPYPYPSLSYTRFSITSINGTRTLHLHNNIPLSTIVVFLLLIFIIAIFYYQLHRKSKHRRAVLCHSN